MIRSTVFAIMFILTVSTVAFPQNDDPFKRVKLISDFVNHGLSLSLSTSDANIRALGKVENVTVEQYGDRGFIMEKRTYYLNGLQLVVHFAKGKDSIGGITEAVVTDPNWKIAKGLRVGTSIDTVIKTLGEPTAIKSAESYEYCGETGIDCALFDFTRKHVVRIKFTYYWD